MIAGWMAYWLLTALLFAGAGLAAEHGLRLHHLPTRGVWLAAILASLTVPTFYFLVPQSAAASPGPLWSSFDSLLGRIELVGSAAAAKPESRRMLARIDSLLAGSWVAASAGLLLFYLGSYRQLRRLSQRWLLRTVEGKRVLISANVGPAVLGFRRGQIVVPAWAFELDEDSRRIVILHEEEHLRAGDHHLLLVALAACVCLPWNPILWWQVRRLRSAVEFDCDRRVLSRGAHPHTYSVLLVEVSRRASGRRLPRAAFAEPRSLLERRIRRIAAAAPRYRGRRSLLAGVTAALLLAFACEARPPTQPGTDDFAVPSLADLISAPTQTPYTSGPKIRSPIGAARAVQDNYPRALKEAGIGGTVDVWVLIDTDGKVRKAQLKESSEIAALDRAALTAARQFEFVPARQAGRIVPAWFRIAVTFAPS